MSQTKIKKRLPIYIKKLTIVHYFVVSFLLLYIYRAKKVVTSSHIVTNVTNPGID